MVQVSARTRAKEALLDAAERLLIDAGHAGITTRRMAELAAVNHGLVHYYFGSMEELLVQVLERFTERLIERQREMYAAEEPFLEKWRRAMRYLDQDLESGYQKIWLELQALAWNRPELRDRIARVNSEWRRVLTDAVARAAREYKLETASFSINAFVALVMTFNQGIILERLSGVSDGHSELLDAIDRWLSSLEKSRS